MTTNAAASLAKDMVQARIAKADACIALFNDAVCARRHIAHDCLKIRVQIAGLIRSIRDLAPLWEYTGIDPDASHAVEHDLDTLYCLCSKLHGLCAYFQKHSGEVPEQVLHKPAADLAVLCEDLALNAVLRPLAPQMSRYRSACGASPQLVHLYDTLCGL